MLILNKYLKTVMNMQLYVSERISINVKVKVYEIKLTLGHRCGSCGIMRPCHAAGPGSIPGRDKFPG